MLSQAALHHDDRESLTGDIPSTAKPYITIAEIEIDTVGSAWYDHADVRYREIVKLADMMEMFHFLSVECLMGNRYVSTHKNEMRLIIQNYVRKRIQWDYKIFERVNEWMALTERTLSESFRRGEHAVTESSTESTQGG
jgi:5'-deoxynucleotidase YfbR-like HD superfamily hydrolase